jgi:methionyl-tRNA formyltransferase
MSSKAARKRVLLVGLGTTTPTAIESLAERFEVVGLVRDIPPAGVEADPVLVRARELGALLLTDATVAAVDSAVRELRPDCVVVSSFHRILPDALLKTCRFVNVHYALLPKYRGRANVNWALINGERETGISIHEMAPGLDAGNILFQQAIPIRDTDDVTSLYDRLNHVQREALGQAVAEFLDGNPGRPQDESRATYGCTRLPMDGEIDWSQSTAGIHRLIRSQTPPFPGAFTYFEGRKLIVWQADPVIDAPRFDGRIPGRVVRVGRDAGVVDVLTGDGVLRLTRVQREGATAACPAAEVIRSIKVSLGLRTADLLERVRKLEEQLAAALAQTRP